MSGHPRKQKRKSLETQTAEVIPLDTARTRTYPRAGALTAWPSAEELTVQLGGTWNGRNSGMARCPAHNDTNPSLSISDSGDPKKGPLLYCFAGCNTTTKIIPALKAMGLWPHWQDEKPDGRRRNARRVRDDIYTYKHSDTWMDASARHLTPPLEWQFNSRAQEFEYRRKDQEGDWVTAEETFIADVAERIEKQCKFAPPETTKLKPLKWGREDLSSALTALAERVPVDPFVQWLESLPDWDGRRRVSDLLWEVFGCASTPLNKWASRYLFLAPLERTYHPGCLLRTFPVLIGPQGLGKSALLKNLFPPKRQAAWFSDTYLAHEFDAGRRIEATLGAVVVEISEMAGMAKSDLERVKGDLTRTTDRHRLAYRRNPQRIPRRFAFVGTSNDTAVLPNDHTGNTRFVAVACPTSYEAIEDVLDEEREQLWAEALVLYKRGKRPVLPRTLMRAQARINEEYRDRDHVVEDGLEAAVRAVQGRGNHVTVARVARRIGLNPKSTQDQRRVSRALEGAGYKKKRTKDERVWVR